MASVLSPSDACLLTNMQIYGFRHLPFYCTPAHKHANTQFRTSALSLLQQLLHFQTSALSLVPQLLPFLRPGLCPDITVQDYFARFVRLFCVWDRFVRAARLAVCMTVTLLLTHHFPTNLRIISMQVCQDCSRIRFSYVSSDRHCASLWRLTYMNLYTLVQQAQRHEYKILLLRPTAEGVVSAPARRYQHNTSHIYRIEKFKTCRNICWRKHISINTTQQTRRQQKAENTAKVSAEAHLTAKRRHEQTHRRRFNTANQETTESRAHGITIRYLYKSWRGNRLQQWPDVDTT